MSDYIVTMRIEVLVEPAEGSYDEQVARAVGVVHERLSDVLFPCRIETGVEVVRTESTK